jgi:PLD-like domain
LEPVWDKKLSKVEVNFNMFKLSTENGVSIKAYRGTRMTLLAMNLEEKPADGIFAGFTLHYQAPKGKKTALKNLISFDGTDVLTGSDVSPIQAFKWVHFPTMFSDQKSIISGKYSYFATPRFFDANQNLLPIDDAKTASVDVEVGDFSDGKLSVGFTRAFVKSQAFANRYGAKQKLLPKGDWLFDTNQKAGTNAKFGDFTYEDMYAWLGFNAREMTYGLLKEALDNASVKVDMFAYDFNDPVIADMCLKLAAKGKIRIILDSAALHHDKIAGAKLKKEDDFEQRFNAKATAGAEIFRCNFARYSHCKEIILRKNGKAYKALTGSTNFSYTGLYVNANHVLVFDDKSVAKYYADIFDVCWKVGEAPAFRTTTFSNQTQVFSTNKFPRTEIEASPHTGDYAEKLLNSIADHVTDAQTESVIFSVMELGSKGSLTKVLREIHKNDSVYTYGVTDSPAGDISVYKPGRKNGLLINAKAQGEDLPPPFKEEFELGLSHAIHHKFIVTNFNRDTARVYCGSSNLAYGGEKDNGDKLLCIKDKDVATAFAIEGLRLTDHYNFRTKKASAEKAAAAGQNVKPFTLDKTGKWVNKFYDENDIRCVERKLFA